MKKSWLVVGLILAVALSSRAVIVHAQESWLDQPLTPWNRPGADVPPPPPDRAPDDPRCGIADRPVETPQDQAIAAGWTLYAPYRAGWGMSIVDARSSADGMCRPMGFQSFVFVDGRFAGTISPVPMDSRTDGATSAVGFDSSGRVWASFTRYAPTDPLCCPSKEPTFVEFRIDRSDAGPALVPVPRQ